MGGLHLCAPTDLGGGRGCHGGEEDALVDAVVQLTRTLARPVSPRHRLQSRSRRRRRSHCCHLLLRAKRLQERLPVGGKNGFEMVNLDSTTDAVATRGDVPNFSRCVYPGS